MTDFLPYGRHTIEDDDIAEVVAALRSGWLTTGPYIERFESALAERTGAKHAVVVNSGTAALHAAYYAAGVVAGDEVITTPMTFAATANAALFLGASPVFGDVDTNTALLEPQVAAALVTDRTRVLAPVDFAGHPADIDGFMALADRHGLVVVEDACHSLGATSKGRSVGSLAHMTVFSFHPVKHVAMGEGGAVVTDDPVLYKRLRTFRTHGMAHDPDEYVRESEGPWYHEQQALGFNYRITDMQCALGVSQLAKLDRFIARRREIACAYDEGLGDLSLVRTPEVRAEVESAWHIYVVRLTGSAPPRRAVFEELRARGIGVQVHYLPVYRHPYYQSLGFERGLCPHAEDVYERSLTIPLFPAMTDADVERVVASVRQVVEECG